MSAKSLPASMQRVLEYHVSQSELTHDDELQGILERLTVLNDKVEIFKQKIKQNRIKKDKNNSRLE